MADTNPAIQAYQTQVQDYQQQVNDLKSDLSMQQTQLDTLKAAYASLGVQLRSAPAGSAEQADLLARRNALSADISAQEAKVADTASALASKEQSLAQSQADLARVSAGGTAQSPDTPAVTGNADPQVPAANQATESSQPVNTSVRETGGYFGTPAGAEDDENIAPTLAVPVASYTSVFNPETGQYDVYNLDTGQVERSGLTEQQAQLEAEDLSAGAEPGENQRFNSGQTEVDDTGGYFGDPSAEEDPDQDNPPDTMTEFTADGEVVRSRAEVEAEAQTLAQAQALQELRAKNTNEDWRLRIRLAPNAQYLYKADAAGILKPLQSTNGVVFPYTPQISTSYRANYDAYELVHTNYKGYFYKNSSVQEISVNAVFTANSSTEADYLLAVIHFFRSASKMFYGQDSNPTAGTPPPVLYMDGLGVYQFNEHPCLLSSFDYRLPSDVDYIRTSGARNYSGSSVNLAGIRNQQGAASSTPLAATLSRLSSLKNAFDNFINPGARANNPQAQNVTNYYGIIGQPTYVPTKIDISLVLLPLISRAQQAQEFSLKNYATGQGLRERGFF